MQKDSIAANDAPRTHPHSGPLTGLIMRKLKTTRLIMKVKMKAEEMRRMLRLRC
jgi:hypothetical protein